jgi:glycolate oxidase FAD binding subunit
MKSTARQLAQKLTSELGANAVAADNDMLARYSIDGKVPSLLCLPANPEQLGTACRLCSETQATVIPWGSGTAMAHGNPPRQVEVVLGTERLDRVIDHDHANLTVTVESGITLARLQQQLVKERQFVPFDPPFAEHATIGGTVAANLNGLRRSFYGSVRDLVIGMKVTLISGEQIKAGGKVVKNVAGYDMCKLFVGSLGTLGVIHEATLRLAPLAESAITMIAEGTFEQARSLAAALTRSPLLPAAIFLTNDRDQASWRLAVGCEGFAEMIERCRRNLAVLAGQAGMNAEFPSSGEVSEFWRAAQNLPLQSTRLTFRLIVPRGEVLSSVESLRRRADSSLAADLQSGTIWLSCAPTKTALERFPELASLARARRGHAVIFAAPSALKQGWEVWGESPPTFSLMRRIKQQFDPQDLLNPGRFLGGI